MNVKTLLLKFEDGNLKIGFSDKEHNKLKASDSLKSLTFVDIVFEENTTLMLSIPDNVSMTINQKKN